MLAVVPTLEFSIIFSDFGANQKVAVIDFQSV